MPDAPQIALITDALREATAALGYSPPARIDLRDIPFDGASGFGTALPLALAGQAKERHPDLANPALAQAVAGEFVTHFAGRPELGTISVAPNGFLNFVFPKGDLLTQTVTTILAAGDTFGRATLQQPGRVMVEYSQPNTHKGFHIGHLRNAVLGASLVNIYRAAGYDTVSANYYGDIGTHVIKTLWAYERFYRGQEPAKRRGTFLGDVYTFAESKYSASEALKDKALAWLMRLVKAPESEGETGLGKQLMRFLTDERVALNANLGKRELWTNITRAVEFVLRALAMLDHEDQAILLVSAREYDPATPTWQYSFDVLDTFTRWENKDPELIALWHETRQWSLDEFHEIYGQLGITFDVEFTESEEEEPGKSYVQELLAQGIAMQDAGALIVRIDELLAARGLQDPEKQRYRTLIILRADGSSLYATKDLSLARKKFQDRGITQSIYVVADEQAFYFEQIFKVLELAGFEQATDCYHLSYGLVTLPDGKMSSRKGNVVLYFPFVKEMLDAAWRIVTEKQPDLADVYRARIARQVAFGAMKYDMLKVDATRTIVFDKDEALS
ncbi:MAG: arginine--tRNA ligase, partial [bacterium]